LSDRSFESGGRLERATFEVALNITLDGSLQEEGNPFGQRVKTNFGDSPIIVSYSGGKGREYYQE